MLIHGWPLSGRSWEKQVPALSRPATASSPTTAAGSAGPRSRGRGYDYDTFAADLDALLDHLDLRDVTLVGFSMGGGEVARYIGAHGTERVAQAVFAGAVPPYLYKAKDNPDGGLDDATIAYFRDGVRNDRLAFLEQFPSFFGVGELY